MKVTGEGFRLVYAEVKKLPNDERYILGDQIRRSVVSITSNLHLHL